MNVQTSRVKQTAYWCILTVLVLILLLIPFHGFLTTWIGANTGGLLMWRAWKEILLLPAILASLYLFIVDSKLRTRLTKNTLNKTTIIFSGWLLLAAAIGSRDLDAFILGLTIYMRLFVVYILASITHFYRPLKPRFVLKLILIPFGIVVAFGLLQMFVLPHDFLTWFGYQKNVTIPPFFLIDNQLNALRIMSTTRGPNSLGVYLILPMLLLLGGVVRYLQTNRRKAAAGLSILLLLSGIVLYGSHSRSAWIGFAVGLFVYVLLQVPRRAKKICLAAAGVLLVLVTIILYTQRSTTFVQNTILHNNAKTGGSVDSNEQRLKAWSRSINDIKQKPLTGCGVGCAGPASFHNADGVKLAENQYLQAAQETGIIGALLFIMLLVLTAKTLLQQKDILPAMLLGSFVGIAVAGLLMHAWADDIVAYSWWIPFGLLFGTRSNKKSGILESV